MMPSTAKFFVILLAISSVAHVTVGEPLSECTRKSAKECTKDCRWATVAVNVYSKGNMTDYDFDFGYCFNRSDEEHFNGSALDTLFRIRQGDYMVQAKGKREPPTAPAPSQVSLLLWVSLESCLGAGHVWCAIDTTFIKAPSPKTIKGGLCFSDGGYCTKKVFQPVNQFASLDAVVPHYPPTTTTTSTTTTTTTTPTTTTTTTTTPTTSAAAAAATTTTKPATTSTSTELSTPAPATVSTTSGAMLKFGDIGWTAVTAVVVLYAIVV